MELDLTLKFASSWSGNQPSGADSVSGASFASMSPTGDFLSVVACCLLLFVSAAFLGLFIYKKLKLWKSGVFAGQHTSYKSLIFSKTNIYLVGFIAALLCAVACFCSFPAAFAEKTSSLVSDTNEIVANLDSSGNLSLSSCNIKNVDSDMDFDIDHTIVSLCDEVKDNEALEQSIFKINGFGGTIFNSNPDGQSQKPVNTSPLAIGAVSHFTFDLTNIDKNVINSLSGKNIFKISMFPVESVPSKFKIDWSGSSELKNVSFINPPAECEPGATTVKYNVSNDYDLDTFVLYDPVSSTPLDVAVDIDHNNHEIRFNMPFQNVYIVASEIKQILPEHNITWGTLNHVHFLDVPKTAHYKDEVNVIFEEFNLYRLKELSVICNSTKKRIDSSIDRDNYCVSFIMPDDDVSVMVSETDEELPTFNISLASPAPSHIQLSKIPEKSLQGEEVSFSYTETGNYKLDTVDICTISGAVIYPAAIDYDKKKVSFGMPGQDVLIKVKEKAILHSIDWKHLGSSNISFPNAPDSAIEGNLKVKYSVDQDWHLKAFNAVSLDGKIVVPGIIDESTRTVSFDMPACDVTIKVVLYQQEYEINWDKCDVNNIEFKIKQTKSCAGNLVKIQYSEINDYYLSSFEIWENEKTKIGDAEFANGLISFIMPSSNIMIKAEEKQNVHNIYWDKSCSENIELIDLPSTGVSGTYEISYKENNCSLSLCYVNDIEGKFVSSASIDSVNKKLTFEVPYYDICIQPHEVIDYTDIIWDFEELSENIIFGGLPAFAESDSDVKLNYKPLNHHQLKTFEIWHNNSKLYDGTIKADENKVEFHVPPKTVTTSIKIKCSDYAIQPFDIDYSRLNLSKISGITGISAAYAGEQVDFYYSSESGYSLEELSVQDSISKVEITKAQIDADNHHVYFTMPETNVDLVGKEKAGNYNIGWKYSHATNVSFDAPKTADGDSEVEISYKNSNFRHLSIFKVCDVEGNEISSVTPIINTDEHTIKFIMPNQDIEIFSTDAIDNFKISYVGFSNVVLENPPTEVPYNGYCSINFTENSHYYLEKVQMKLADNSVKDVKIDRDNNCIYFNMPGSDITLTCFEKEEQKYSIDWSQITELKKITISTQQSEAYAGDTVDFGYVSTDSYQLLDFRLWNASTKKFCSEAVIDVGNKSVSFVMPECNVYVTAKEKASDFSIDWSNTGLSEHIRFIDPPSQAAGDSEVTVKYDYDYPYTLEKFEIVFDQSSWPCESIDKVKHLVTFIMPNADVEIKAQDKIPSYNINWDRASLSEVSFTDLDGGSPPTEAPCNEYVKIQFSEKSHYLLEYFEIFDKDYKQIISEYEIDRDNNTIQFIMPNEDAYIKATQKLIGNYSIHWDNTFDIPNINFDKKPTTAFAGDPITFQYQEFQGYSLESFAMLDAIDGAPACDVTLDKANKRISFSMPEQDLWVSVEVKASTYNIDYSNLGSTDVLIDTEQSPKTAVGDTDVTLYYTESNGYHLDNLVVLNDKGVEVAEVFIDTTEKTASFKMPNCDVSIRIYQAADTFNINWSYVDSNLENIIFDESTRPATADNASLLKIDFRVKVNSYFYLSTFEIWNADGSEQIQVPDLAVVNGSNFVLFSMPSQDVLIKASELPSLYEISYQVEQPDQSKISFDEAPTQLPYGFASIPYKELSAWHLSEFNIYKVSQPKDVWETGTIDSENKLVSFNMPAEAVIVNIKLDKNTYNISWDKSNSSNVTFSTCPDSAEYESIITLDYRTYNHYALDSVDIYETQGYDPQSSTPIAYAEIDKENWTVSFTIPGKDITIKPNQISAQQFNIDWTGCENVTGIEFVNPKPLPDKAYEGETIVIEYGITQDAYSLSSFKLEYSDAQTTITIDADIDSVDKTVSFIMPNHNVSASATSTSSSYAIDWDNLGTTDVEFKNAPGYAVSGTDVTVSYKENDFYVLDSVSIYTIDGQQKLDVAVSISSSEKTITFNMPAQEIRVVASCTWTSFNIKWDEISTPHIHYDKIESAHCGNRVTISFVENDYYYLNNVRVKGTKEGSTVDFYAIIDTTDTENKTISFTMPGEEVKLLGDELPVLFNVDWSSVWDKNTRFNIMSPSLPCGNTQVSYSVNNYYTLEHFYIKYFDEKQGGKLITIDANIDADNKTISFDMPAHDVRIEITESVQQFAIDWENAELLDVSFSDYNSGGYVPVTCNYNDTICIKVTEKNNFVLNSFLVCDNTDKPVAAASIETDSEGIKYVKFTMPGCDVYIYADQIEAPEKNYDIDWSGVAVKHVEFTHKPLSSTKNQEVLVNYRNHDNYSLTDFKVIKADGSPLDGVQIDFVNECVIFIMPNCNVKIFVTESANMFSIDWSSLGSDKVSFVSPPTLANPGQIIVNYSESQNYHLDKFWVCNADGTGIDMPGVINPVNKTVTFTMPYNDIRIRVDVEANSYNILWNQFDASHIIVINTPEKAAFNSQVTISYREVDGYKLDDFTVCPEAGGDPLDVVIDRDNHQMTFTMPGSNVYIKATESAPEKINIEWDDSALSNISLKNTPSEASQQSLLVVSFTRKNNYVFDKILVYSSDGDYLGGIQPDYTNNTFRFYAPNHDIKIVLTETSDKYYLDWSDVKSANVYFEDPIGSAKGDTTIEISFKLYNFYNLAQFTFIYEEDGELIYDKAYINNATNTVSFVMPNANVKIQITEEKDCFYVDWDELSKSENLEFIGDFPSNVEWGTTLTLFYNAYNDYYLFDFEVRSYFDDSILDDVNLVINKETREISFTMPTQDIYVVAVELAYTYNIIWLHDGPSDVAFPGAPISHAMGEVQIAYVETNDSYLAWFKVEDSDGKIIDSTIDTQNKIISFIMPNKDVTITWKAQKNKHDINWNFFPCKHIKFEQTPSSAVSGEQVNINYSILDDDYILESFSLYTWDGEEPVLENIPIDSVNKSISFAMPTQDVTVNAIEAVKKYNLEWYNKQPPSYITFEELTPKEAGPVELHYELKDSIHELSHVQFFNLARFEIKDDINLNIDRENHIVSFIMPKQDVLMYVKETTNDYRIHWNTSGKDNISEYAIKKSQYSNASGGSVFEIQYTSSTSVPTKFELYGETTQKTYEPKTIFRKGRWSFEVTMPFEDVTVICSESVDYVGVDWTEMDKLSHIEFSEKPLILKKGETVHIGYKILNDEQTNYTFKFMKATEIGLSGKSTNVYINTSSKEVQFTVPDKSFSLSGEEDYECYDFKIEWEGDFLQLTDLSEDPDKHYGGKQENYEFWMPHYYGLTSYEICDRDGHKLYDASITEREEYTTPVLSFTMPNHPAILKLKVEFGYNYISWAKSTISPGIYIDESQKVPYVKWNTTIEVSYTTAEYHSLALVFIFNSEWDQVANANIENDKFTFKLPNDVPRCVLHIYEYIEHVSIPNIYESEHIHIKDYKRDYFPGDVVTLEFENETPYVIEKFEVQGEWSYEIYDVADFNIDYVNKKITFRMPNEDVKCYITECVQSYAIHKGQCDVYPYYQVSSSANECSPGLLVKISHIWNGEEENYKGEYILDEVEVTGLTSNVKQDIIYAEDGQSATFIMPWEDVEYTVKDKPRVYSLSDNFNNKAVNYRPYQHSDFYKGLVFLDKDNNPLEKFDESPGYTMRELCTEKATAAGFRGYGAFYAARFVNGSFNDLFVDPGQQKTDAYPFEVEDDKPDKLIPGKESYIHLKSASGDWTDVGKDHCPKIIDIDNNSFNLSEFWDVYKQSEPQVASIPYIWSNWIVLNNKNLLPDLAYIWNMSENGNRWAKESRTNSRFRYGMAQRVFRSNIIISGKVLDESGCPIKDATIYYSTKESGATQETSIASCKTDQWGEYTLIIPYDVKGSLLFTYQVDDETTIQISDDIKDFRTRTIDETHDDVTLNLN